MTKNIAKIIDHTNVSSKATKKDIEKLCEEVKRHGFGGICIRPEWVSFVKKQIKGVYVKIVVLVDEPIGDSSHKERVLICKKIKKDGGDHIDIVNSIPDVKHGLWNKVLKDLKPICKILPTKIIIGSGYLTDDEIIKACQIAKKAGAICVKTATSKDPLEHRELKEKFYHLKLMKKSAPGLLVKASGKIKTLKDLKEAVKAGADIIGTSSGVKIMKEFFKK
ncbi:MAG: deoxyribose-phosphate aldolase [Patescibacteria group bacterium]|nr:deoxyribose-phosphate aldolase [Patescibacteria group bacterium]